MGTFLSFVSAQGELKTSCQLINFSLAKIRELHGSFKSICDNFAINLTEFETIFSSNEVTFAIWDTDNNGLVDAMEVFAGLIIFADSRAEDKIRFLFDLFDFNEIQTISVMDLEFAIQCIVISTSKIFQIGIDVDELEIARLIRTSFADGIRITLPQLLKWASITEEPKLFFNVFRMDGPQMISVKTLQENEFILYEKHLEKQGKSQFDILFPTEAVGFVYKNASQLTQNRRALNFRSWLHMALQPIIAYRLESKTLTNYLKVPDELKVKLEWVYGIRTLDCKRPMQYLVGRMQAQSTGQVDKYEKMSKLVKEELIYFVANIVILLNPNICKQRFYVQHQQEVLSCAVSNVDGGLCATGELGDQPAIHVWSSQSLDCLKVLKGIHSTGVHLLAFSNDDSMLISCGLNSPSSVIIYRWQSGEAIISTSVDSPTQEIFVLPKIQSNTKPVVAAGLFGYEEKKGDFNEQVLNARDGFAVVSLTSLIVFNLRDKTFSQTQVPLNLAQDDSTKPPICALSLIADNRNNYFALLDQEVDGRRHIFLTGHRDGKVLIWRSDHYIGMLADYRDEITAMSACFEGIAIGSARGFIHIWDNYLSRSTKTIELSSLPFKVLSFGIINIDFNQRRLLVLTTAGDTVEIQIDQSHTNKIKAKRINFVSKIQRNQRAASILNQIEKTIMVSGDDGMVLSFDMATHELIDVWQVGAKVTALSSLSLEEGGFIVAAGTSDGNLIIRQDWEEIIPRHHYCGHKQINDVAFSKNGALVAVASSDKHIYLFQYQDNDYQKLAACRLENGFPIALNFSEDSKKVVICTNQRKLLLLDPQSYQLMFRVEDLAQYFWSSFVGKYPLVTKSANSTMIPFALGNVSNIAAAADENGNVFFWKDVESIREHIGVNMTGHASAINNVQFTKDDKRLISFGSQDLCVLQWRINPIEQLEEDGQPTHYKAKEGIKIVIDDDSLINELNFCYSSVQRKDESKEDQGVLIRGSNNLTTNKVLAQFNFEFQEQVWKRPPALSLVIDHIYGVQTAERRNTVFYMHLSQDVEPAKQSQANQSITQMLGLSGAQNARLDEILPKILGPNYQQLLDGNQTIKYDTVHQVCQKFICYFTSRYAVMFTPPQEQRFYEGHTMNISCICKHPFKRLLATGEVNINPQIHIWDAQTSETIQILDTSHRGGVLHLCFSKDGSKLISIGMDRTFSIQVFNWEQNRTIAFRNLGYLPVFGVKFDPYDHSRFITCGYEHMACWKISGSHLSCVYFQSYQSNKVKKQKNEVQAKSRPENVRSSLISLDFLSYKLGHSTQSDALFGTSSGEILTFCSGRLLVLNETAHEGAINCLMIVDQLTQANNEHRMSFTNVITGGEDGLLKIWDSAVNLLQVVDTRSAQILKDLKNPRAYGIQSLDFYCCDKKNPRRLLIGQRCGEVLEAVITEQYGRSEEVMLAVKINNAVGEAITAAQRHVDLKFDFFTYISAHSSLHQSKNQKKIFVAIYPLHPIMATTGDDETLRFWDINKKVLILSKNLGTQATSLIFSPDGSYLIVGLINGVMLVLESKIDKLNFGTYLEEYTLPSLEVLISPKESKSGIVCMKFSYKGDYLAVSFNNEYTEDQVVEEQNKHRAAMDEPKNPNIVYDIGSREPSFILLYVNRHSIRNPGIGLNKKDPYVKLGKIILPLADFQPSSYIRSLLAVTHMDFSEDDEFIQFCVQRVNAEGVKYFNNVSATDDDSSVKDIVIVWNIKKQEVVIDFDLLKDANWPEWSMGPTINARKKGSEVFIDDIAEERKLLYNELIYMSAVQRFGLLDNAVCGGQNGTISIFRFLALTVERLKVKDFSFDVIRKREMAATRSYQAHSSMINNIEISQDKLVMSTATIDQCIIQWRVEYEDQHWELDFNAFINDIQDPFAEVPSLKKFEKLLTENWPQRTHIAEINQGVNKEEYEDPACELQLEHVIGRRAYDRRNNLKVDCMDRVCYQAGSLQVFMQENEEDGKGPKYAGESRIKQTFLRPEKNKFSSISPELSHFCLSQDLRTIFIASAQQTSCVYVWELTTNTYVSKIELPNCPVILNIKVAQDNNHILVVVSDIKFLMLFRG